MYILIINVIKEIKDMKKKSNKKGFTIMEMLIVVAIIAVLAAIAIPVFNGALTKSKEAADVANVRAAYAEMQVAVLTDDAGVPTTNIAATKTKTTTATEPKPITDYLSGDLNYEKLSYSYDSAKKVGTIKYTPTKFNEKKPFEWTIENPSIN